MRNPLFVVTGLLAVLALPHTARSDGGYVEPSSTSESDVAIEMVDQRALLWVGAQTNELWLQNQYRGSAESVGWVIPIPHLPSVECTDDRLLDALDYETAPMFAERYWSCGSSSGGDDGFGCFFHGDVGTLAAPDSATDVRSGAAVTEWAVPIDGCPGMEVVSTTDGEALVAWLSEHGYPVDDSLSQLFIGYASRGWVFLVGEIAPDPSSTQSNTTLRIRWPRLTMDPVVYPMALTGATAKTALNVRLYVAGSELFLPSNYPSSLVPPREGEYLHNAGSYSDALEWTLGQAGGTWAIEYASHLFHRYSSCPSGDTEECETDAEEGIEDAFNLSSPEWLSEIWSTSEPWAALRSGAANIVRLTATLKPEEMREDVVFAPALIESFEPTFLTDYPCGVEPPGQTAASALERHVALDPFLVLGLMGGVAFRKRQRRSGFLLLALALGIAASACGREWGEQVDLLQIEICDGADNNGDGRVDELWPLLGEACTSGVGACGIEGHWSCAAAGDGVFCSGATGPAGAEICNGIDDDCNGVCDEGSACCYTTYSPCTNACGHVGNAFCGSGCEIQSCLADPPESFSETALPYVSSRFAVGEIDGAPGEEMVSVSQWPDTPTSLAVYHSAGELLDVTLDYGAGCGDPLWLVDQDGDGNAEGLALGFYEGEFHGLAGLAFQDGGVQEEWRFIEAAGPDGPGATYDLPTPQTWLAAVHTGGTEPAIVLVSREEDGSAATRWILRGGLLDESATLAVSAEYGTDINDAWVEDFNGDGADDLLLGPVTGIDVIPSIYLLFDSAALLDAADPIAVSIYNGNRPAAFADLDHDGAAEIIFETMDDAGDYEVIDLPSGTSLGQLQLPGEADYNYLYTRADDFDGDGFDELVFTSIAEDDETGVHTYTFTIAEEPTVVDGTLQIGPLHDVVEALEQPGDITTMELDGRPGRDLLLQTSCSFGDCWEAVYSPAGCAIE
jgi:hypothetical protein